MNDIILLKMKIMKKKKRGLALEQKKKKHKL